MDRRIKKNPWLGLQTYVEGDVLYGRDDDIRNLSQFVLRDSETVLYGKSGIGKSSVLNAGVIPRARMNGIIPIVVRLAHGADAEPYVMQIIDKIKSAGIKCNSVNDTNTQSLWEFIHKENFVDNEGKPAKLLLIFDQFEEIFTLQQSILLKKNFFQELADVINDVMPSSLSVSSECNDLGDVIETCDNTEVSLDDMDFDLPDNNKYCHDNEIHLVFTLREDFLSEFEYYTASIPSLKQHRYGLRPINEEQASEIIQAPCKGLVSQDVAKLIIEKVTKRNDFELDGIPEIEVDAAVLSLYLSKLFDKSDKHCITKELVEREAGNIIKEFYEGCITNLPLETVDKLENILVNKEGHRENMSLTVLSEELGIKNCVEDLIKKKLLRTFKYAGEEKVELIHDVLCDVVKNRKEEKEKRKKEEEERQILKRQRLKYKIRLYVVSVVLVISIGAIIWLVRSNRQLRKEEGFGHLQEFAIKFTEDSLVVVDNEFWDAHFLLVSYRDSVIDTIYNTSINKAFRDSTFRFAVDSAKYFNVTLDFETGHNRKFYKSVALDELPIGFFTKNKELKLSVNYDASRMVNYEGHLAADVYGNLINLQDAIVILRDQVKRTDANGCFRFLFEDSLKMDESIFFFCKGFNSLEDSVFYEGILCHNYVIEPADSLASYMLLCQAVDTIDYYYKHTVPVRFEDERTDEIVFFVDKDNESERRGNKLPVKGYYYYLNEYNSYSEKNRFMAYHLLTGWMNLDWETKQIPNVETPISVKDIEFVGYDKVHNKQTLVGWRMRKDGCFHGTIYDLGGKVGTFGE